MAKSFRCFCFSHTLRNHHQEFYMLKTKLVLLLVVAFAFATAAYSQSADNVTVKVAIVDKALNLKNVPKFVLVVRKSNDASFAERKISTDFDGTASMSLSPGDYVVRSENPVAFEDKSFSWEVPLKIADVSKTTLELSNDNAKIAAAVVS